MSRDTRDLDFRDGKIKFEKKEKYEPYNPIVDNFTDELSSGISNAKQCGKYIGALRGGKPMEVKIRDSEMAPALEKDDLVTIVPATLDKIKIGDFVFFRQGSSMFLRRVIRSVIRPGETYLVTKAERAKTADKPLRASKVVGKVGKLVRDGKSIRIPNRAGMFDKMTAFGVVPFHKALLKAITAIIPFVNYNDGLVE